VKQQQSFLLISRKQIFVTDLLNAFPSSLVISHFVPTLLLYEVMLKDEKGQSWEGVMGHWDHPVGTVLLREAGNCWLTEYVGKVGVMENFT
jgi:hypothetical protein